MPPRIYVAVPLRAEASLALPAGAARHVQVLRLQPGDELSLFDGSGGQWSARILRMGRQDVQVEVGSHQAVECEIALRVTLALGMPANERMDGVVEKATELGVAAIQPLVCERSVLRLSGERAQRKQAHWQAVAVAAAEQCGRNRVPVLAEPLALTDWLSGLDATGSDTRLILCPQDATPWAQRVASLAPQVTLLSGPEGGLTPAERERAQARGFLPTSLGSRVLRADTAPLAALAGLALLDAQ